MKMHRRMKKELKRLLRSLEGMDNYMKMHFLKYLATKLLLPPITKHIEDDAKKWEEYTEASDEKSLAPREFMARANAEFYISGTDVLSFSIVDFFTTPAVQQKLIKLITFIDEK